MLRTPIPCSREDVMEMVDHQRLHRRSHCREVWLTSFPSFSYMKEGFCLFPKGQIPLDLGPSFQLATSTSSSSSKHDRHS